jgi:YHYH protein
MHEALRQTLKRAASATTAAPALASPAARRASSASPPLRRFFFLARVMRTPRLLAALLGGIPLPLRAHVNGDAAHDAQARLLAREFAPVRVALLRHAVAETPSAVGGGGGGAQSATPLVGAFGRFSPAVRVRSDGTFLCVESNGLPAHAMMVGITAWQQQVPLPQPYTGANAWRIPLKPVPSPNPVSIKNRFLRGAIALAANGVPIFNPQNNRGEISQEIGELDQWGGHCGRADDYHYHAAPLHLQRVLGPALPVAYALDGYAIYGLAEPDGAAPQGLDAFNGHETAALGYHYHASEKYPYVNGGFHGVVVEKDEQVDPQPRAQGVRPALTALRGARIVGFEGSPGQTASRLTYTVNGTPAAVTYEALGGGRWKFQFANADGSAKEETYRAGERGGGGGGKQKGKKRE